MSGKRGFASLTPERRYEISRMGALAAHAKGTAHKWTSDEAREAGRKGGQVSKRRKIEQQVFEDIQVDAARKREMVLAVIKRKRVAQ